MAVDTLRVVAERFNAESGAQLKFQGRTYVPLAVPLQSQRDGWARQVRVAPAPRSMPGPVFLVFRQAGGAVRVEAKAGEQVLASTLLSLQEAANLGRRERTLKSDSGTDAKPAAFFKLNDSAYSALETDVLDWIDVGVTRSRLRGDTEARGYAAIARWVDRKQQRLRPPKKVAQGEVPRMIAVLEHVANVYEEHPRDRKFGKDAASGLRRAIAWLDAWSRQR